MKRNEVSEKSWNEGASHFFYTPHLTGDTLLIKKCIILQDFVLNIYYYFIVETNDGIKRFIKKSHINKPGLKFNFKLTLQPIFED